VEAVREKLRTRLRAGVHRPGDRFLSARELAQAFGVSYQTAHRVLETLCAEGLLERRAASGTYIPGGLVDLQGVQLLFNPRARREQSFGGRLLADLTARLERDRVSWKLAWTDKNPKISRTRLPVLWEAPVAARQCGETKIAALLLNDRPRPGLEAALLDSVSIDDFSGGASAAQLLAAQTNTTNKKSSNQFVVLTGPADDARSNERRDGFLSVVPGAAVVVSPSWFFEDGFQIADAVVKQGRDGIFCCNDRLAQAVLHWCDEHHTVALPLVGFDDAPVAETLDLTTIALPWEEMIAGAADVIKRRLAGAGGAARQLIFTPRPVIRRL
jgi:hypothetical protein